MGTYLELALLRDLEDELCELPQVDLSTAHLLHAGLSARAIFIPAGTVLTGALTRIDNLCIVLGDITVTTGERTQRLTGFHLLPAAAGAKRAGYAHSDTYWVTVHRSEAGTVEEAEEEMTQEAHRLQTRTMPLLGSNARATA